MSKFKTYKGINNNNGSINVSIDIIKSGGFIEYKSGDITVLQLYHPFWLIPKCDKKLETHRMVMLDFSKK